MDNRQREYLDKRADLVADIKHAQRQAKGGPYYPRKGITAESLRLYAAKLIAELEALDDEHAPDTDPAYD